MKIFSLKIELDDQNKRVRINDAKDLNRICVPAEEDTVCISLLSESCAL